MPDDKHQKEEAHKYEDRDASAHRELLYGNFTRGKNRSDDLAAVAQTRYFKNITRIRPSEW